MRVPVFIATVGATDKAGIPYQVLFFQLSRDCLIFGMVVRLVDNVDVQQAGDLPMSMYQAVIEWHGEGAAFVDNRYSRGHRWLFDGGIDVPASSSPQVVPVPMSVEAAVDPEEAFVASLSSCHMLWFLSIAAKRRYVVDAYRDEAIGEMSKDKDGNVTFTKVTLYPAVTFMGDKQPAAEELHAMHEAAHHSCYIAKSVKCEVRCEPTMQSLTEVEKT